MQKSAHITFSLLCCAYLLYLCSSKTHDLCGGGGGGELEESSPVFVYGRVESRTVLPIVINKFKPKYNPKYLCTAYFGLNVFITMGNTVLDSTINEHGIDE